MSRFISPSMAVMAPYVPGEQPKGHEYIKLNTNENPYPPSPQVEQVLRNFSAGQLRLYPEIADTSLGREMAREYGLAPGQVFAGSGSDEVLGYAFMAFFERDDKVYFPDITYGFYQVYADLMGLAAVKIPLREDFTLAVEDYFGLDGHIVIANPNAPTGICLAQGEIERILKANPDRLVIVDEAYIDFAREQSCVNLLDAYDNLLVVQTFSKSRCLAGMRIGFGFGCGELIADLDRAKFSFNPYNLDWLAIEVGKAAIRDGAYTRECAARITATREETARALTELGLAVLPSQTNFLFACAGWMDGGELCGRLREKGILVRHFAKERIAGYLRISVGTPEEMERLTAAVEQIREECAGKSISRSR